jgi:hypothetical protein
MPAKKGNKYAKGNKGGSPGKYKPEYAEQVYKLCLLGATDEEIATFFKVQEKTINNWKRYHQEFLQSLKKGKIIADAEVAASLHKRALGFEYDEITYEKINIDVDGVAETNDEDIKTEAYKKMIVPDVAAQNIWLKNRRGRVAKEAQRWADKVETGVTDNEGNDVSGVMIYIPENGRKVDKAAKARN